MDGAWNHFYHVIIHTHGSWLPGDPRGFRTRHHREHVQGDYKNPPPQGQHERRHQYAQSLLTAGAIVFDRSETRRFVCDTFSKALLFHKVALHELCVSRVHVHLLARFMPPPEDSKRLRNPLPRWVVGKAKSWTTRQLKQRGYLPKESGAVFAEKGKVVPIRDEAHGRATARYIRDHADKEGAAIWTPKPPISRWGVG